MILISYFLLQLDRISSTALSYSFMNAAGAFLILVSLTVDFNFSAFVIEAFWLLISIVGIVRRLRKTRG